MLIAQENNIEHYPITFNIFLLLPIPGKILCIFYQTSPHVTPEWHTKWLNALNVLTWNLKNNYLAIHYIKHVRVLANIFITKRMMTLKDNYLAKHYIKHDVL